MIQNSMSLIGVAWLEIYIWFNQLNICSNFSLKMHSKIFVKLCLFIKMKTLQLGRIKLNDVKMTKCLFNTNFKDRYSIKILWRLMNILQCGLFIGMQIFQRLKMLLIEIFIIDISLHWHVLRYKLCKCFALISIGIKTFDPIFL